MADAMKAEEIEVVNHRNEESEGEVSSVEEIDALPPPPVSSSHDPKERKEFMLMPSKEDEWQCCYIDRISVGMTRLDRKYALYGIDGQFYAACEKRKKNKTPHYVVCTDPNATDVDRDHPLFVGKIRSNFFGSEFTAYDMGRNPKKVAGSNSSLMKDDFHVPLREELVHISYMSGLVSNFKSGRKMQVVIPKVTREDNNTRHVPCRPLAHEKQGLRALSKERLGEEAVTSFVNRPGRWSPAEKCYRIDWVHVRTPILSRRNFQLVRADDNDEVVLQFGKGSSNRYFIDFRAGISPFQALSVAVSMLDYKYCTT